MRQIRKIEHIKYALETGGRKKNSGFGDICLVNNSLPELSLGQIDTTCLFLDKRLSAPILINAMTGGHPETGEINRKLARAAQRYSIAMAVGSQAAGLQDNRVIDTFSLVREANPDGVILANLSAAATTEEAMAAVRMVEADGLQLHLNVPQELAMPEGERSFCGIAENIKKIVSSLDVPVIVKEVGFGLSRESACVIYQAGARYIDTGGVGGTNFIHIENCRSGGNYGESIINWGVPTAASLLEIANLNLPLNIIAGGGVRDGLDVAKSIAMGAVMAGMAGPFLRALWEGSESGLHSMIESIKSELSMVMLLSGAGDLSSLSQKPVVITGKTAEWLTRRGVDINYYGSRG